VTEAACTSGATRRVRAQGAKADLLQRALEQLDPELGRWANEFVFGEVWREGALSFEERMIVAIAALAATGRRNQLRNYLHGALHTGEDPARLREIMRMMTVYCGFPVAIEAMIELDEVLAARARGDGAGP
jgi:4-carboxymuconolactone decarboxylase